MDDRKKVLVAASVASMISQFNMPNIRLMLDMGYEVHVACNFREGNTCDSRSIRELWQALREIGVVCHQWDCPREIGHAGRCMKAYSQIRQITRGQFAWMHCHSPVGGALARIAAHQAGIPAIYTAHGFHFYRGAPLKNWLLYYPAEKLLAHWTDVLVTVNKEDYCFARRHLKPGKACHIPGVGIDIRRFKDLGQGAGTGRDGDADQGKDAGRDADGGKDTGRDGDADQGKDTGRDADGGKDTGTGKDADTGKDAFRRKYRIPQDALILLSVGELSRRKNHQDAICALAQIARRDVYYIICGQGACRAELMRQAGRLGVAQRVRLAGFEKNVEAFYRNADIFVFPSLQEGMPVALMEAMAAGLPCVVSDVRGNRELIRDASVRFQPGNPGQLKKELEMLIGDSQLRAAHGSRNAEKIQPYSLYAVLRRMEAIYAEFG